MDPYNEYYKKIFGPLKTSLAADIIVLLTSIVGIILNLILAYITAFRLRRAADTNLILIISIFDVISCGFMMISIPARWILGMDMLQLDSVWCHLSSILFCANTIATVMITAILSLVRYLTIVREFNPKKIQWTLAGLFFGLGVVTMFIFKDLDSGLIILPSGLYCAPKFWGPKFITQLSGVAFLMSILISLCIIPICYSKLSIYYYNLISRVFSRTPQWSLDSSTYCLFGVVIAYTVTTLPEFILVVLTITGSAQRDASSDSFVIILLFGVTIVNGLFALMMHNETRHEFNRIIGYIK